MITRDRDFLLEISAEDLAIYARVIRGDSPLLDALQLIPWESFRGDLEKYYVPNMGQPALPVIHMLKLEFLRYTCRLSDRGVVARAQTDLLFRWFLQVPIRFEMPDASTICRFRARLGVEGFQEIFDRLIAFARDAGVVRDRLRLKDATHVLANIAVPTTLRLLAQLREKMLSAIESVDAELAAGYHIEAERIQAETEKESDEIRLQARLDLVLDMLQWMQRLPAEAPDPEQKSTWQRLLAVRSLAEKITADCLNPGSGDRTLSVVDPEARRGKHGEFYDGYMLDVMMDADSGLVTQIEVLPANGAEAHDAISLVQREHAVHGNQIEQLSIDGAGFNGPMLRTLEDPNGLAVDVITPPSEHSEGKGYPNSAFLQSEDGQHVTCPAGHTSGTPWRKADKPNSLFYDFSLKGCRTCSLLSQCYPEFRPTAHRGRRVSKNEYETEYERARAKVGTEEYRSVRKEHPAIERKLNEIVRHGCGRRARYWGRSKVKIQELMTGFMVNVRRLTKLLKGPSCANMIGCW
ncbi:transposase [Novipirellula sp. SH528]|uniref:transposase n=1 Tax=Novipirellula sp. SH528 TaxID=3454466 RepID=UPI003F9F807C